PVAQTGLEGAPIALDLGATINGLAGDTNSLASLDANSKPLGPSLSDGTHPFTAAAGSTALHVAGWTLACLTVTPRNDTNFSLSLSAIAWDVMGYLCATPPATETTPFPSTSPSRAPVAQTGLEGAPIALDLGATINGLAGDTNSL